MALVPSSAERRARIAASTLAVAIGWISGCTSKGGSSSGQPEALVVEPPVPAPAELIADVALATPSTSWTKLQRAIGGPFGLLPTTFAGAVLSGLGLDATLASEVDVTAPMFGVVAGPPARPAWALAMRLADPRHARSVWLSGDTARFDARPRPRVTELVPRGGGRSDASLGLTGGGWLLVASSGDALEALGPYAARTLPTRPAPEHALVVDVPGDVFASVVAPRLESGWGSARSALIEGDERQRKEHGGRAPDFGDPKAIVAAVDGAITPRLALLGDVAHARLTADPGDEEIALDLEVSSRSPAGSLGAFASGMRTFDARKVAVALPARSALVLAFRPREEEDGGAPGLPLAAAAAFASKLAEADQKRLRALADDWALAGGDTVAVAVSGEEPRELFARAGVRDPEAAGRVLESATALAAVAPFRDMLHVASRTEKAASVPEVGEATVVTFTRAPGRAVRAATERPRARGTDAGVVRDRAPDFGIAWTTAGAREVLVGAGDEPGAALLHGVKPSKTLGDEPAVVRAFGKFGTEASAVLVAQPLLLDPTRAPLPTAPLVVVVGKGPVGTVGVHASVAHGLIREASRRFIGF